MAQTRFTVNGTAFERQTFASAVDGVVVVRITASRPGALTLRLSLTSPQSGSTKSLSDSAIRVTGHNRAAEAVRSVLNFAAEARVRSDGRIAEHNKTIEVVDATEAVILIDIATNFRRFDDLSADPVALVTARLDAASLLSADELRSRHVADHSRFFSRVSIELAMSRPLDCAVPKSPCRIPPSQCR